MQPTSTDQTLTPGVTLAEGISQVATLAKVACTKFYEMRIDRVTSNEVDDAKSAKRGTTKVSVNLLKGCSAIHAKRCTLQDRAQNALKENSLFWEPGGIRLLPNCNLERWLKLNDDIEQEDVILAREMEDQIDWIVQVSTANTANYNVNPPTRNEILEAYSMRAVLSEVPSGKFPNAPPGLEDWLKRQYEENFKGQLQHGLLHKLGDLMKPLTDVVERLALYEDRDHGREGSFKNTLVSNLQDALDSIERTNIVQDPVVQSFLDELKFFRSIQADDLRKHKALASVGKSKAQEVIDRLSNVLSPAGLL